MIDLCFGSSLRKVESEIFRFDLMPKHGPGATSDGLRGNRKWNLPTWHARLQPLFPVELYGITNERFWDDRKRIKVLEPMGEVPSKLVPIPKTATKPRLIAEEPTCMQFVQQAVLRSLVDHLESGHTSKWFVGFSDQVPNQELARIGSMDGRLATLDLSDASDSVANWLVEALFEDFPLFSEAAEAVRTRRVRLPSGDLKDLQKYASMGSALTFPIEAMVFSAVAIAGVLAHQGSSPTPAALKRLRGMVRVYGDDIIVPADCAETVTRWLWTFGFRVNSDKSFWTGEFRESCGKEYWLGHDVSVVKFRKKLPASRRDVDEVVSTVATRNLLYTRGLRVTAARLDDLLEGILGYFPWVTENSPVLGRVHESGLYQVDKMHPDYQSPLVKGWVVRAKSPKNRLDGSRALFKCLVETVGNPDVPDDHLIRSGRPAGVSINLRMAPPF